MLRNVFAALLAMAPAAAFAQSAGGYSVEPSKSAPDYSATVTGEKPSPVFTQDRVFSGTRFWKLDPGRYEAEVWFSDRHQKDGSITDSLLQLEMEIGLTPHIQIDIYQNLNLPDSANDFSVEGVQLEMRYAFATQYNAIPLNPVLYLEWHPRKDAQDRAEVRLLLGGDASSKVVWAANLYGEMNVDQFNAPGNEGADAEVGVSAASSYGFGDHFRLGAEIKTGVDQHGGDSFKPVLLVGPNVLFTYRPLGLKLTATGFFGLMDNDPRFSPYVIAGWQF